MQIKLWNLLFDFTDHNLGTFSVIVPKIGRVSSQSSTISIRTAAAPNSVENWIFECKFSVFSSITHKEINILLFGVFMILENKKLLVIYHSEFFAFPGENKKLPVVYHHEFFVFPGS